MTYSAAPDASLSHASLSLTSRTDRGGYVVAVLRGELGIASAPALREQLLSLLRASSQLVIDLSAVEHADASGLAVLVGSGRRAMLLGGSLRLAAPSLEVARVLSVTGLDQHLDIFPTVRAAITGQRPHEGTADSGPTSLVGYSPPAQPGAAARGSPGRATVGAGFSREPGRMTPAGVVRPAESRVVTRTAFPSAEADTMRPCPSNSGATSR